ncbi:hypothetical protein ACJRO7_009876 [Eucalyptus globulus]|uniref:Uncharacterized protein n=1 Tax=Eucalyptus globulus TaxID=34317 RepID=A0ABD3LBB2_EUCGL
MRYAGVLYRIDPHDAFIGLANGNAFVKLGLKFMAHSFQGCDLELQVLSSESQPEKVTSDMPDDPAIIQVLSTLSTYGLSDSLKPPVIVDSLTSTPMLIPSDLPLGLALLISDTLPNVAKDLLSSRIMSISSAAKCSSTAGLNVNPIPQVIHGATFVQGSGLVPESLPLAMFRMN